MTTRAPAADLDAQLDEHLDNLEGLLSDPLALSRRLTNVIYAERRVYSDFAEWRAKVDRELAELRRQVADLQRPKD
jgi:hypothetical protein